MPGKDKILSNLAIEIQRLHLLQGVTPSFTEFVSIVPSFFFEDKTFITKLIYILSERSPGL